MVAVVVVVVVVVVGVNLPILLSDKKISDSAVCQPQQT